MRKPTTVAAVVGADFHASDKPPAARATEVDWLKTQAGYWKQARDLCDAHGVPFLIAGDVFDDGWRQSRCSPALINMVLRNMPRECYGVPGQHDLPHHRLDAIKQSAFYTLVEAGKLTYLEPDKPVEVGGKVPLRLWGFPWGVPIAPLTDPHDMVLEVAVVHAYVWVKGKGHAEAAPEARLKNLRKNMMGYDAVVIGDNHTPWEVAGKPYVWNNGGFLRRRVDEKDHKPRLGLLQSDGSVVPHYLNIKRDKFAVPDPDNEVAEDGVIEFVKSLRELTDSTLDFEDAVLRWLERKAVSEGVRRKVLEAMGGGK